MSNESPTTPKEGDYVKFKWRTMMGHYPIEGTVRKSSDGKLKVKDFEVDHPSADFMKIVQ